MRVRKIIQAIKCQWELVWLLCALAMMPVLFSDGFHRWLHFRGIKQEFRSEMNPAQVQQWASNILKQHYSKKDIHLYPHGSPYPVWFGTNMPPGASKIAEEYYYKPKVEVYPDHVVVFGGGRGAPELWAGSTNFVYESDHAEMWKPGVYIVIPESSE